MLDVQTFQPTAGPGTTFQIDRPEVLRHRTFVFGLSTGYAYGLLERQNVDGSVQAVVPHRGQAELAIAFGLYERIQLSLVVPAILMRSAVDPMGDLADRETYVGLGDLRLGMKFPLLRGNFAISGQLLVTAPTAFDGALAGQGHWTFRPSVIVAGDIGDLRLTGELGWLFRDRLAIGNLEVDDELVALAGLHYAVSGHFGLIGEASARMGLAGRSFRANEVPIEVDVGARIRANSSLAVDVAAGTGVMAGYGAPLIRAFAMLRYTNEDEPCADGPEDFDGFEDGDFCLDPDNDGDGIRDTVDECPNDPEDFDGFLDDDGCAEADNDADSLSDAEDQCPLETEDTDGYQDEDGCPELDNDDDSIVDGLDDCPLEPEDRDDFQDEDGCPEPGPRAAVVTITDTRILISERIYFEYGAENVRSVSYPLLDQVAAVILELPEGRRIRVEGYTDSDGHAEFNLDLSYRRARAVVEYLIRQGVPAERLSYVGYGEASPVAPNDTQDGRALNRRVEFTIVNPEDAERPTPRGRGGRGR